MPPKRKPAAKKASQASSKRKRAEKDEIIEDEVTSVSDTTGTESEDTASVAFSDSSLEEHFPSRKRGRGRAGKGEKKVQKPSTGETSKGKRGTQHNSSGSIEPSSKTVLGIEKIKINYIKSEEEISNNPDPNISQEEFEEYLFLIVKDLSMLHSCGEKKPTLSYSAGEEELDNEANDTAETSSEEKGEEEEDDSDEEAKPTAHTAVNYYSNVCPIVRELSQLLRTHKVYALIRRMVRPKGRLTREQKRIMANELNEITQLYNFVLRTRGAGATKDRICIKQTYLFPCVVEFVLRLCSRVENSNSALVSSLELLQFIMTEIQRSALNFAMLLFVSCPACLPMFYQFRDFRDALFFISELLYKAGLIKKGDITNNGETSPEKVVFLLKVLEIETEYFDPSTGIFSVFCQKNPNNRSSFWRHHSCPCAHTHQTVFQLLQYSEYCSEQNCLISPPHFVPWKFLSAVYDAALSFESEETGEPKKKAAKKQTKGQKAKESAEATNPAPTHEKWATATLQHIHVESEVFDESNHNKRYNNIVLTHQYILSQMDPRKKNDAGFNFYILMRQADRDPFNSSLPGDRRSVESLLPLLDVTNHIALQVKGGDGEKCTCTSLPYTSTYIEHHERHLAEMVNSLEEEEMLPFSCVPMKNNHYKSLLKEEQFYSRALNVSYGKQQDLFQEMDVDDIIFNACEAGNRLCDVEKELSTNEESAHLMDQLYKTYIKNCTLKQHQIQNLLRMSRREETPFLGYFEFPLLQLITDANGNVSVNDGGSFFYCALNGGRRYVCDASSIKDGDVDLRPTRGGFFCDSVGLGKTLSLIALSAHDRLVRETVKASREESTTRKRYQTRLWCVPRKEVAAHLAGVVKSSTVELFNLPRTTLVVVPMSIVVQWEQEIIKFYPSAKYILFYGAKRFKYTEKDFLEADFVITTYETLSTHLRDETDFTKYGISPDDDPVRVKITSKFVDIQKYFFKLKHTFFEYFRLTFSKENENAALQRDSETVEQHKITYKLGKYTCVVESQSIIKEASAKLVFSTSFLDKFYEYYKTTYIRDYRLRDMVNELSHADANIRHRFIQCVLLNDAFDKLVYRKEKCLFPRLLVDIKNMYGARFSNGLRGIRILDLNFRRVVLDECQKCGKASLLHYLNAERRWATSGTPVSNNSLSSLSSPFLFLGLKKISSQFSSADTPDRYYSSGQFGCAGTVDSPFAGNGVRMECMCAGCIQLRLAKCQDDFISTGRNYNTTVNIVQNHRTGQQGGHRITGPTGLVPAALEVVSNPSRMFYDASSIYHNTLFVVASCFIFRHERKSQLQSDMHLDAPIHESYEIPLSADEMHYYDILATFIYNTASLLSRQGLLASRATAVLQWMQDLSCTCIHPKLRERIFRDVTENGGVQFAERLPGHFGNNNSSFATETNQAIDVAKTFLTVTAAELLSWLGEMRDVKKMRVPEDTFKSAHDLHAKPPRLPVCTVCLDTASEPTYLCCLHYFCKECCLEVINNSISYAGNITAKCPMCRNKESMLVEKRVVQVEEDAEELEIAHSLSSQVQSRVMEDEAHSNNAEELTYDQRIRRIGAGSRVKKVMEILHTIWSAAPTDKVIIFSKYPQALHLVQDAVRQLAAQQADNDFDLFLIDGSVTLSKRRNILTQLGSPHRRGVLLLTSRAACAGLNLIFANHVLFLEPNMNPAMEIQAIGRVHRFGQQKQVKVYHLYSPHTIDQLVYARSTRLLNRIQEESHHRVANGAVNNDNQDNAFEVNVRHAQLGQLEQDDMLTLLTYPIPRG